ncbi:FadR/GntR family transcriptional regulator [Aquipuribacter nitratireducens]|uniref:FadR/GntR family transcriptional regulator n=1 Tax=Aquipuribacter nitratireducens TaxID=650104 RepID=A0ABW0GQT3_9MICO
MPTQAPATRAQALAGEVERTIAAEGLTAGDPVGTIDGWRLRSGFGRATVSEAVRLLVDRGVVEVRPGRGGGVFVAGTGPVVRLRHTLLSVHGHATTLADALAIREALEPLVVADAARSRTAADLRRLRSRLRPLEAAVDDHDAFVRAVWSLHEAIAKVTPNEMLRAMYLATLEVIDRCSEQARSDADDPATAAAYRRDRLEVHRELVDAIADGDEDVVARALARHRGGAT